MEKIIYIKQVKGTSRTTPKQKAVLKSLGVYGIGTKVFRKDTRALRGMLNLVQHLVDAQLVDASVQKSTQGKRVDNRGYSIG
jgi:ribosomal protein L30